MTVVILMDLKHGRKDMEKIKKYKMVSINYTNECAKKPRCSFCYLKKAELFDRISEFKVVKSLIIAPMDFYKFAEQSEQIAIAYNGLKIAYLNTLLDYCQLLVKEKGLIINITTNPQFLEPQVIALFKRWKVKMIALSMDSEKCNLKQ